MKEVIERCNWLVNKCEDKAITPDVKDDVRYLLEEIERLQQRIDKATGIANERINYCYHENDKEQLESWDEMFDILQGIDENE